MNKSSKLVQGVGLNDGKYPAQICLIAVKEYNLWNSMLARCTKRVWKRQPSYIGTSCSENFKHYSFFYEWCQEQKGFNNKDEKGNKWHLDKDILVKGNKVYSEDVCVFVPQRINSLLLRNGASRGEYPVGVCLDSRGNRFVSRCNNNPEKAKTKQRHLGYFDTPQEAFQAYKTFKEALIKEVANEYKEQLDSRVYEALMNYEVNEND